MEYSNNNSFRYELSQYNNLVSEINTAISKVEEGYTSFIHHLGRKNANLQTLFLRKIAELHPSTFLYQKIHSNHSVTPFYIRIHLLTCYKSVLEQARELFDVSIAELAEMENSISFIKRPLTNLVNEGILLINKANSHTFCCLKKSLEQLTWDDVRTLFEIYDTLNGIQNTKSLPSEEQAQSWNPDNEDIEPLTQINLIFEILLT